MSATVSEAVTVLKRTHVRYFVVFLLFLITTVNHADRAALSIAGPHVSKDLGLGPVALGYAFSAFGWSYAAAQIPGGWLLDKFGSKIIYTFSIMLWSIFTLMQGWIGFFDGAAAVLVLFALRLLVGLAEAPSFPGNARIVSAWFPGNERGTASAFFNSGQYFATVLFTPLMAWITHDSGWHAMFFVMGGVGVVFGLIWIKTIKDPKDHPAVNTAELDYISQGGGLIGLDQTKSVITGPRWSDLKELLRLQTHDQ